MTVAAIIQARMGSSRLPGKSLATLGEHTVLDWVTLRAQQAARVGDVLVATSTNAEDDVIAKHCEGNAVRYIRGSERDVLGRFHEALSYTEADVIVRLTADCPFVDPGIIDHVVDTLEDAPGATSGDYASTSLDGRYPRGLDAEAVLRSVLIAAFDEADDAAEREHVTLFVYRRPERFRCLAAAAPAWARRPGLRFTVDELADLALAREIVRLTGGTPGTLTGEQIVFTLDRHPEIIALNAGVKHRNVR